MITMNEHDLLDKLDHVFKELIYPFHVLERDIPFQLNGQSNYRNETDTEHSFTLALVSILLAPHIDPALDIGKCCQLSIVHDLIEVYAGDTSFWANKDLQDSKKEREAEAVGIIKSKFGSSFPNLPELIDEYELKSTKEAQFISALDKFLALAVLQTSKSNYFKKNKLTKTQVEKEVLLRHRGRGLAYEPFNSVYLAQLERFMKQTDYFHDDEASSS
ncbi:TPA: HD domain-containing protein [Candidatus Saccharibacteria bacterium]|nr:HD domain-containing protein [Candidatus Saccharibacteria bacterium]HIO87935.1 HD domain-containing protein [Candidatus Saccharibacteria bacterium]